MNDGIAKYTTMQVMEKLFAESESRAIGHCQTTLGICANVALNYVKEGR